LLVDAETGTLRPAIQKDATATEELLREINGCVDKVTTDIENLRFNTAIAKMMEFVNCAKKQPVLPHAVAEQFTLLLSPFAPHMAEELWERLGHADTLAHHAWPKADPQWLTRDTVTIVVQVNGKKRDTMDIAKGRPEAEVIDMASQIEKVKTALAAGTVKKQIYVPDRLVNFIVG
jgi:leucyl-tRNA synthetase